MQLFRLYPKEVAGDFGQGPELRFFFFEMIECWNGFENKQEGYEHDFLVNLLMLFSNDCTLEWFHAHNKRIPKRLFW